MQCRASQDICINMRLNTHELCLVGVGPPVQLATHDNFTYPFLS
jgi:hypothetical protein